MNSNVAFVGPAGVGKTTLAKILVNSMEYRRHALADALKVGQGFLIHWQLGLPILGEDFYHFFPYVDRIVNGQMGIWEYRKNQNGSAKPAEWLYNMDVQVRDFLLDFVNSHKEQLRDLLQQYGTEVIRGIGAELYPDKEKTDQETWISVVLRETERDNAMGIPVCCDDVRYPHEADAFRKHGWEIVRVTRTEGERGAGINDKNINHSSEQMHMGIVSTVEYNNDLKLELASGNLKSLLSIHK